MKQVYLLMGEKSEYEDQNGLVSSLSPACAVSLYAQ